MASRAHVRRNGVRGAYTQSLATCPNHAQGRYRYTAAHAYAAMAVSGAVRGFLMRRAVQDRWGSVAGQSFLSVASRKGGAVEVVSVGLRAGCCAASRGYWGREARHAPAGLHFHTLHERAAN